MTLSPEHRHLIVRCIQGAALLGGALVVNYYASVYATERASAWVNDIILNNLPVFDVDDIFLYGPAIFWTIVSVLCLERPTRIPFILKSIALFILIRAGFVTLTHLGPFPTQVPIDYTSDWIWWVSQGGDKFFSGHTGLPFLIALVFEPVSKRIFWIFTAAAAFFGAIVLMAHLHYSIDVASAFFITYAIYRIALHFFKKDAELFEKGKEEPTLA